MLENTNSIDDIKSLDIKELKELSNDLSNLIKQVVSDSKL